MGRDTLDTRDKVDGVDWNLPGMERFSKFDKEYLRRSIDQEVLVNTIHAPGWVFWPTENVGYFDADILRLIADFLEIQNKPFWDEYEKACLKDERKRDETTQDKG